MFEPPEARYALAGDGAHLAYQVIGAGEPTVFTIPAFSFSIDVIDDEPHWSAFDRRLVSIGRLVRYDDRGIRRVESLLFCDVVASTESAAQMGDRTWRARLDGHDLAVARWSPGTAVGW